MKKFIKRCKLGLPGFVHNTAMLSNKVHAAVFTVAVLASNSAHAVGVSGIFSGWKGGLTSLMSLVLAGGITIGVCATLYGIINLIKKGMGRGDDVEWGTIMWPIIGGALATVVLYILQAVVEEGGAGRTDMNTNGPTL